MSKASALAAATGGQAPTIPAAPANNLTVSPRQAARVPVPKDQATPGVTTPAAPVVPPADPNTPPNQVTGVDSDRFAHLAKKEVALQKEREALKAEREQLASEKTKFAEAGKKYQGFEELKAKDPIAAMKLAGFTDTDIFNFYAKAQEEQKLKDTPEAKATAAAQAEIEKFRKEQSDREAQQKAASDARIIQQFKGRISQTITADKDKFELCNFNGPSAESLIYETVETYFREHNEVLSPTEAAEMVEKYYEDQAKAMSGLKKLGAKPAEPAVEPSTPPPPPSKTLTNRVAPTVASSIPVKETREQKRERLIQNIKEHGLRK